MEDKRLKVKIIRKEREDRNNKKRCTNDTPSCLFPAADIYTITLS